MGNKLFIIPLLLTLYLPIAFFTTYGIAVGLDHVYAGFPYISDTGTKPPESCIFGQLLNIYAALAALFMVVRYSQVKEHILIADDIAVTPRNRKLLANKSCLVIGLLAAFGASLVGNFQEDNVIEVHVIGAFMAFGLGGIYSWLQSILSYYVPTLNGSSGKIRHTRLFVCISFTISFILMTVFTSVSMSKYKGDMKYWKPDDPGYTEHLVATITEWLLAIIESIFFATFIREFRMIGLQAAVIQIQVASDEQTLI